MGVISQFLSDHISMNSNIIIDIHYSYYNYSIILRLASFSTQASLHIPQCTNTFPSILNLDRVSFQISHLKDTGHKM